MNKISLLSYATNIIYIYTLSPMRILLWHTIKTFTVVAYK
jgi:hypothetical protein